MSKAGKAKLHDLSDEWKVDTSSLFEQVFHNPGTVILIRPFQIFASLLQQVAQRAIELDDPELHLLMCRLTLYSTADPSSPDYDKATLEKLKAKVKAIRKAKGEPK